jgi:mannose-6-phosphate isomerase-like protein (cupin superfamily)
MIIERSQMEKEVRPKMRGGKGEITLTELGGKALQKHLRVLSEIVIPPCASIGVHEHSGETEYFIILEGEGVVDDSGTKVVVKKGDVVVTGGGATHGIENTGMIPIRMVAVIVTD